MGIGLAKSCCTGDSDSESAKNLAQTTYGKSELIREDYAHFKEDKWFRFHNNLLFEPNKFIFLYPEYHSQQETLVQSWKKVDMKKADSGSLVLLDEVMSPRWKYAIRKGVPLIHYKTMIGLIFNRNFDSNTDTKTSTFSLKAFKDQDNMKNDLFGFEGIVGKVKQYVHGDFLNQKGVQSVETLLNAIQMKKGQIVYNPYILHIVPLMLIFLDQEETFEALSILIDNSTNPRPTREASLRWHFTLTESQLDKLTDNFFTSMKDKSVTVNNILNHLNKYQIEPRLLYRDVIENFFYGYLPFPLILKIFLIFLNEGVKTFHRMFYSLLKLTQDEILQMTNLGNIRTAMKKRSLKLTQQERSSFLKVAYTIRMSKYNHSYGLDSSVDSEQFVDNLRYYMPQIKGDSQILSFLDLQTIWEFLPIHLKNYDCVKKFTTPEKGKNNKLPDLIHCIKSDDCGFIVIETQSEAVFGVFLASWLKSAGPKQYYGSSQNFLFQIYPHKRRYTSSAQNIYYCFTPNATQCKIGGGGSGPALELKMDLNSGLSFKSDTYINQPLHGDTSGQFKIKRLQAFQLY